MKQRESRSRFLLVKCKCGNEMNIFHYVAMPVYCEKCNELVAEPTGGKSKIYGDVLHVWN